MLFLTPSKKRWDWSDRIYEEYPLLKRELEGIKGEYDMIIAQVEDKNKIGDIAEEVRRKIRDDRNLKEGEEDFTVQTPDQSLEGINTILSIINYIVIGIAALSLIVGGVGITNTMYTSVLERTKEIGVMKSIGAQNKDILMIFLIESGLLGLVGGIIGVILGFGIGKLIEFIVASLLGTNLLRVSAPIYLIIGCLAFAFLTGVIAGTIPAWRAAKTNVVDALRYE